jgi:hypothetical protein
MSLSTFVTRSLVTRSLAVAALAASSLTLGCVSTVVHGGTEGAGNRYQHFAAGYLGCRAREITIEEYAEDTSGTASWVASCQGQRVVCGGYTGSSVHCTEARELPPIAQ